MAGRGLLTKDLGSQKGISNGEELPVAARGRWGLRFWERVFSQELGGLIPPVLSKHLAQPGH